jgi:E3 ubiquitin-protein ligase TRIP12
MTGTDNQSSSTVPAQPEEPEAPTQEDQDESMAETQDESRVEIEDDGHGNDDDQEDDGEDNGEEDDEGDDDDEAMDDEARRLATLDELDRLDSLAAFGGSQGMHFSQALRAISGMVSGMGSRLRDILSNLRQQEDPSVQLIALQDLAELLLVSSEDHLTGQFMTDAFVKELITLMQYEDSPEIMLLACRCIANLIEAIPSSVSSVVHGGAVPILCQKLLEIAFIDLAEQALTTLEKISVDYPTSIVREGGLTACLSYLEFFPTSTQRSAVTTAANCCRNIPHDSFSTVRDVMPILLNIFNSGDQRVVEKASLCVTGIVESFRFHPSKLEELVSVDLLKTVLSLLVPGATNMIGPSIHTQFLRLLGHVARASPTLSAEMYRLNIVETIYLILTGVSPPSETDDVASKLDSVVVMQALIHRPRDQIIETLNVICELLPGLPNEADPSCGDFVEGSVLLEPKPEVASTDGKPSANLKRIELLGQCKPEVRRFALILFPTLTDAYSSTVNQEVRRKVLTAQVRMLSNLDPAILAEALSTVPYASFLTSILSQRDDPALPMYALQAAEFLVTRIDDIYRYQLYREGVISEVTTLAATEIPPMPTMGPDAASADEDEEDSDEDDDDGDEEEEEEGQNDGEEGGEDVDIEEAGQDDNDDEEDSPDSDSDEEPSAAVGGPERATDEAAAAPIDAVSSDSGSGDQDEEEEDSQDDGDDDEDNEDDDNEDDDNDEDGEEGNDSDSNDDQSASGASSPESPMSLDGPPRPYHGGSTLYMITRIRDVAKKFLEVHEGESHDADIKRKATSILANLSDLSNELEAFYVHRTADDLSPARGEALFAKLATHFSGDVLNSITSAELLASGLVRVLLDILGQSDNDLACAAQATFLEIFMASSSHGKSRTGATDSAFGAMIRKLQDVLSRSEHFEVLTVHHASDGHRNNATSMLAKQIKLRMVSEDSTVPRHLRTIMVSIHAIATFKSLDDYLRPRLTSERTSRSSRAHHLSQALAAMAGAGGLSRMFAGLDPSAYFAMSSSSQAHPPPPPPPPAAPSAGASGSKSSGSARAKLPVGTTDASSASTPTGTSPKDASREPQEPPPASEQAPLAPPAQDEEDLQETLECVDETRISDDEPEDGDGENHGGDDDEDELDAVVGDLDEDMTEAPTPDPSAVNLEVATSGKVTARREDGTRILTPSQSSMSSLQRSSTAPQARSQAPPTPTPATRASSQLAAPPPKAPQDWHIEFSIDGKAVPNETTIYRAIHSATSPPIEHSSRGIWQTVHTIKWKRVEGPPPSPENRITFSPNPESSSPEPEVDGVPGSLAKHPSTASILRLLNILHDLNANMDDVLVEHKDTLHLGAEPLSQFVNTKLTAKLNRQLEEPLIVASSCLPGWSEDLPRLYPFLFPFETRHLFLQSTSFGYARSMTRWQSAQGEEQQRRNHRDERPFLGRLQRQKVRISRLQILESALKVMELYGTSQSILEVEYFEEVGTGLGPTLEFYSNVSREFAKTKLRLWRDVDTSRKDEFISITNGLFPRPMSADESATSNGRRVLHLFKMLGIFVARSMIDARIIDINFNPIFFRVGDGSSASGIKPSLGAVKLVDPGLARSLKTIKKFAAVKRAIEEDYTRTPAQKVADTEDIVIDGVSLEDLCLDFTLPGYPDIDLIENGAQVRVSIDNVERYIDSVLDMTLGGGVRRQIDAFREGFSLVFPYSALSSFTPDELVTLFGRSEEDWSLETLMDSIKADHGYNMDSKSVKNLMQVMSEFDPVERRLFLQFTTGSPKLPIGGFRALTPMFTVVLRSKEAPFTFDAYLPSVMTCVNYLKLPDYSTLEVLRRQLTTAIREGQGAFHLS